MTIASIILANDKFTIISDTLASAGNTPAYFAYRTLIYPHLQAGIADRGVTATGRLIDYRVQSAFLENGIEDALPIIRRTAEEETAYYVADPRYVEGDYSHEAYVVGWSARRSRFAGWYWGPGCDDWRELTNGVYFSPRGIDSRPAWEPVDRGIRELAQIPTVVERIRRLVEADQRAVIGGELYATSFTRQGITIRRLHRFSDYNEMREGMRRRAKAAEEIQAEAQ